MPPLEMEIDSVRTGAKLANQRVLLLIGCHGSN